MTFDLRRLPSQATLAAAAIAFACSSMAMTHGAAADDLVVKTDKGAVHGAREGDVESFLGIPYAAPPVGTLRWRAPQPMQPWADVREATAYGAYCAAAQSTNGPRSEAEDCLFINVQRPAHATGPLPVYVFIHGGGLLNGSSNQADMAAMVAETGIIGVTMNYRLGVLGFLAHPSLTAEGGESGNYGLLDQQAALRWLQANIAAFGGDPAHITVGGESAGGWSVCAHLAAPGSAGLYSQAIMESGSCASQSQSDAEATDQAIVKDVGCSESSAVAECLRGVPVGKLIDVQYPGAAHVPLPVHGGAFLPLAPREAIASGTFPHVPVLIGANRDEGRTFAQGNIGWTQADYTAWVRRPFAQTADKVLGQYPWPQDANKFTGAYLSGAVITDAGLAGGIGGCSNLKLTRDFARHTTTYAFEFAHRKGPGLTPALGDYEWGAGHAAELAYLFPSFNNGVPIAPTFDKSEQALAKAMKDYWGAFVTTGTPSAPSSASWPPFNTAAKVLSLRPETTLVADGDIENEHNCAFWASLK